MIQKYPVDVLLVEDSPTYAEFVIESLAQSIYFDYHVTPVETLAAAKAEIAKKEFGIVILDLYLPNGEGVGLVETMRAILPQAMLIVITAYSNEEMDVAVRWAAADEYISKNGLTCDKLLERVRRWAIRYTGKKEREEKFSGIEHLEQEIREVVKVCEDTPSLPPYPS